MISSGAASELFGGVAAQSQLREISFSVIRNSMFNLQSLTSQFLPKYSLISCQKDYQRALINFAQSGFHQDLKAHSRNPSCSPCLQHLHQ